MLEVRVQHSVGETLSANTDTLEYTVASQLMHYQMAVDHT